MIKQEVVNPNVGNLIQSLRDIGYTFEIAVADILDNSISAGSKNIIIRATKEPEMRLEILDDGSGMIEQELVEAMRLASKNPGHLRQKNDLGRFGLGLKTASFSQCTKLTVVSKKDNMISFKSWDLNFITQTNEWILLTPELDKIKNYELFEKLNSYTSGTLIVWEAIDLHIKPQFSEIIDILQRHLSLVFHRFIEGKKVQKVKVSINHNLLKPFNPFNINNFATQEMGEEHLSNGVVVKPFVLPHHSKVSQEEYERFQTDEGYTRSQGFYLYRANRLLIYGTWWGLHKASDVHKLIRIQIDIPNDQDYIWGIDIKKSTARPVPEIRNDLKRVTRSMLNQGSRPYTGRGKRVKNNFTTNLWDIKKNSDLIEFVLNFEHPLYKTLLKQFSNEDESVLRDYLKAIQTYIPFDAILAHLHQNPYGIKRELNQSEVNEIAKTLKFLNLSDEEIANYMKTDVFKNHKEAINNGNE